MTTTTRLLTLLVSTLLLPAAYADHSPDEAAVIETMQQWESAVESGDYERLANYYTEDAIYYPNNRPPLVGRDSIMEQNQRRGSGGAVDILQTVDNVEVNGNWAVYSCLASVKASDSGNGNAPLRQVRVLILMEKGTDGQWRIHRDIDNTPPEIPAGE